jgi:hypothetical protein
MNLLINQLINSMELSTFREATSCAVTQERPRIFIEPESSLPHSQKPYTGFYPEPDCFGIYDPILSVPRSVLILSIHLHLGCPSSSFHPVSQFFKYITSLIADQNEYRRMVSLPTLRKEISVQIYFNLRPEKEYTDCV